MVVVMRVDADRFGLVIYLFIFQCCLQPSIVVAQMEAWLAQHVQFSSVIRNTCSSDGPLSIAAKPYFCLSLLYSKQDDGLFPY